MPAPKGWSLLGSGAYNTAYVSDDGRSVLKIQKDLVDATDDPERSVRLWNAINAHIQPPATVFKEGDNVGWVCPFIEGRQASDAEMSEALIDLYTRTGRIVVDATAPKNFKTTPPPNSQVVCVDIGMAMQMERREEVLFSKAIRRKSLVSLQTWQELNEAYQPFFKANEENYPKTVETVKSLIFIKNNRPDIFDVSFLKNHPELTTSLAKAYDAENFELIQAALEHLDRLTPEASKTTPEKIEALALLKEQRALNLQNIKESFQVELQRYIDSRGAINKVTGEFTPSLTTRFFRNTELTSKKVSQIIDLKRKINDAGSLEEINAEIMNKSTAELFFSRGTSGLKVAIGKCMVIIESTKNNPDYHLQNQEQELNRML